MLVRCLLYPFDDREAAYNGYSQQIHIVDDGYLVLNCKESVFAEAECSFEECAELAQLLKIEYTEADDYNKLAVDMADNNGYLLHALLCFLLPPLPHNELKRDRRRAGISIR